MAFLTNVKITIDLTIQGKQSIESIKTRLCTFLEPRRKTKINAVDIGVPEVEKIQPKENTKIKRINIYRNIIKDCGIGHPFKIKWIKYLSTNDRIVFAICVTELLNKQPSRPRKIQLCNIMFVNDRICICYSADYYNEANETNDVSLSDPKFQEKFKKLFYELQTIKEWHNNYEKALDS